MAVERIYQRRYVTLTQCNIARGMFHLVKQAAPTLLIGACVVAPTQRLKVGVRLPRCCPSFVGRHLMQLLTIASTDILRGEKAASPKQ
jgi:hypothetical protein